MVERFFSRHALHVFSLERTAWEFPLHKHNFYELIFIESGSGKQWMNDVVFSYKKGDIFLLTPEDSHRFDIAERTLFTFVKFTEQLLAEKTEANPNARWRRQIDRALLHPNTRPCNLLCEPQERDKLFQLLRLLQAEYAMRDPFNRQVVLELFGAMMVIVARGLHAKNKPPNREATLETHKVGAVLSYIRQHLFERDKLSLSAIAEAFFMSPNYVGIFIKKHTGMSIRDIVMQTRLKTAERLLLNSSLSISEIAARLCFSDPSHFTKIFKKYRGETPKRFRSGRITKQGVKK